MSRDTPLERLARLEEQMGYVRADLVKVGADVSAIKTLVEQGRGAAKAAGGGLSFVKAAYPPASAALAYLAMAYGLPWPRA